MTRLKTLPAVAALCGLAATSAYGQLIPITNAGFEIDVITDGAFQVLLPTGWQAYDPSNILDQGANSLGIIRPNVAQAYFPGGPPVGSQAALVYLAGAANGPAGLEQALDAELTADTRYTLSAAVGNIASGTSLPGSSGGAGVFYNLDGFPGYRIELLAGSTILGADSDSAGSIPEGEWRTATLTVDSTDFASLVGQQLSIRLVNLDNAGTPLAPAIEVDFDAVSLMATPVPEPSTMAMWLAGLVLIGAYGVRRKSSPAMR